MTPWRFLHTGGLDQPLVDSAADLARLRSLDPKLWVALACPVKGLEFDTRTLELIDTDGDGRIRVPEILAAVDWALGHLKDASVLASGGALPLAAIDDTKPAGAAVLASAKRILANLGKAGATTIDVADTSDTVRIFAATPANGDGVIPVDAAAGDAEAAALVADIAKTFGTKVDRSGKPGIDRAEVAAFFDAAAAFVAWWEKGDAASPQGGGVLPLGDDTPGAYSALQAVRAKVADYFARCRLAAFDPQAAAALNPPASAFVAVAGKDLSTLGSEIRDLPIAHAAPGKALSLVAGVNPAWEGALAAFRAKVVEPLLGKGTTSLDEAAFAALAARFDAFAAWQGSRPAAGVDALGIARLREVLASGARARVEALLAADEAVAPEVAEIETVDRLARYHRDLATLLRNFVNFADFYADEALAIFQAGTLYLDGRACRLVMRVDDAGKHASLAPLGKTFLAYCTATRKGEAPLSIVAAFTAGDAEHLRVGRNGLFVDRRGRDWDATITKTVEAPISIREAIWSPYKRVARLVGEQIEKFAASKEKAAQDRMAKGVEQTAQTVQAPGAAPAPVAAPGGIGQTVGILAAVGLALGAIGTALATVFAAFMGLAWWQMPLAILGILVAISGPSVILAWLKLRQRNLGPILDASGWAVNGRVMINLPLGRRLTERAVLPSGSELIFSDAADRKVARRQRTILAIFVVVALLVALAILLEPWLGLIQALQG